MIVQSLCSDLNRTISATEETKLTDYCQCLISLFVVLPPLGCVER